MGWSLTSGGYSHLFFQLCLVFSNTILWRNSTTLNVIFNCCISIFLFRVEVKRPVYIHGKYIITVAIFLRMFFAVWPESVNRRLRMMGLCFPQAHLQTNVESNATAEELLAINFLKLKEVYIITWMCLVDKPHWLLFSR